MAGSTLDSKYLLERYERAKALYEGIFDINKLVLNPILVPHWIGDTDYFWYRRRTMRGTQFRLVNAKTASNRVAFDHRALADALAETSQRTIVADDLPITKVEISLSPLQVSFLAFDNHFVFDAKERHCRCLNTKSIVDSGLVSPDGKKYVFIQDYNLWLQDLETGDKRALTTDGEKLYAYAVAPIALGLATNKKIQALWSADSKRIFTVQTDNRQVKTTPIVHHVPEDGSLRPYATEYRCAYPGDDHVEEHRLVAIDSESGKVQAANYRRIPVNRYGYGLFVDQLAWWNKDHRHAYFVETERGGQIARVVEFDTYTGYTRILLEETSKTYIKFSPIETTPAILLPLPESDELIWYSERSGWGHLYLYDMKTGSLKHSITEGKWLVRDILQVDIERRELWIQTAGRVAGRNPYYQDICRVDLDTGEILTIASNDDEYTLLASKNIIYSMLKHSDPDGMVNTSGVSPSSNYLVTTRSRVDKLPVSLLLNRNGEVLLTLETAETIGLGSDLQWPEPVKLKSSDDTTDIYGVLFKPSDFSPDKNYPVIDCSICNPDLTGAPKGSFGNDANGSYLYLLAAAFAELGFIIVIIDGRGTACRDRAFIDASYGWEIPANHPEDRISGIKQLAQKYTCMDLERVGFMDFGSDGRTLLSHSEFYKVNVCHGIVDKRLMAATLFSDHYKGTKPSMDSNAQAEHLIGDQQGKLLLVHGLLDSIGPAAGTLRIIDALSRANKDFDMLLLPSEGHPPFVSRYALRRTWDYFVTHLQGITPPREFEL